MINEEIKRGDGKMEKDLELFRKKVAILTNNIHCERHVQYFSTLEKYFRINGWQVTDNFDVNKVVICGCGFHDGMYNKVIKLLDDLKKINFLENNIVISACLPKTQASNLKKDFKGHIVDLHEEKLLDQIIRAEIPFEEVKPVNRFRIQEMCGFEKNEEDFFYIKISEGCLRKCTFCVINKAKGYIKSVSKEVIKGQVKTALEEGFSRFFLMGEDTFAYGFDMDTNIIELVEELVAIDRNIELFFGYLHIRWLRKYFGGILTLCKRGVFKELHIGLQHVNDRLLERMGRPEKFKTLYEMISRIKRENPQIYMVADIMVGFPGETKEMFEELVEVLKNDKCFNKVKHFGYSDVTGSISSGFGDKVPLEEITYRWHHLDRILGERSYSAQSSEDRIDNETFRKTRFKDYFFCKNSFDEDIEGITVSKKIELAKQNIIKSDSCDFNF